MIEINARRNEILHEKLPDRNETKYRRESLVPTTSYYKEFLFLHGSYFINPWILFHSTLAAVSCDISFLLEFILIKFSFLNGSYFILSWILFHAPLVAGSCNISFLLAFTLIKFSCLHGKYLILWVVPTTFIIKHRQLPAQRFINCLVFLWNEITRQTLWNVSHSFPTLYLISIWFLFHFYFISILFLPICFISLVARSISSCFIPISFPFPCNIIAVSFPFHCDVIAISLLFHCYFILISQRYHWYFISISFPFHCNIIAVSLLFHCNIIAISLVFHFYFIPISLWYYCDIIGI